MSEQYLETELEKLANEALASYGLDHQVVESIGIFSELNMDISHWVNRPDNDNYTKVRSQIGQAFLQLSQLVIMFGGREEIDVVLRMQMDKLKLKLRARDV